MWTVLSGEEPLNLLLEDLRKEVDENPSPTSLRIYGCVVAVRSGRVPEEVVVDQWPDWTTVITRPTVNPHPQQHGEPSFLRSVSLHTRNVQHFQEMLPNDALDWNQPFVFTNVPVAMTDLMTRWTVDRGRLTRWITCQTLVGDTQRLLTRDDKIPDKKYTVSTISNPALVSSIARCLHEKAAEETVDQGRTNTENLLRYNVTHGPSSCVLDLVTGEPVAHVTCHYFGAIGMLDVSKRHKGRGLGAFVLRDLAKKLLASNKYVWAQVEAEDKVTAQLFYKSGFESLDGGVVTWLAYRPTPSKQEEEQENDTVTRGEAT